MIPTGAFSETILAMGRYIMINILIFHKLYIPSCKQAIILSDRRENMLNSFIIFFTNIFHLPNSLRHFKCFKQLKEIKQRKIKYV